MKKNKARVALLTGITGQDGSYLTELLLAKSYQVHGIIRRSSTFNTSRKLIYQIRPDEIYNLGAQSHVRVSFDIPEYTMNITGIGALRILEAIKDFQEETGKKIKYYQASSSEMFGSAPPPQSETTPFHPRSPYGIAKVMAYHTTINYREAYGLFAVNGILFNHESPRRGETFVTRKITRGIAR